MPLVPRQWNQWFLRSLSENPIHASAPPQTLPHNHGRKCTKAHTCYDLSSKPVNLHKRPLCFFGDMRDPLGNLTKNEPLDESAARAPSYNFAGYLQFAENAPTYDSNTSGVPSVNSHGYHYRQSWILLPCVDTVTAPTNAAAAPANPTESFRARKLRPVQYISPTEDAAFRFAMSFTSGFAVREFHLSSIGFHCIGVSPLLMPKGAGHTGKAAPTSTPDSFVPTERFGGFYSGTGISYPENAPPMGPNISNASFVGSRGYHYRRPWITLLRVDTVTALTNAVAAPANPPESSRVRYPHSFRSRLFCSCFKAAVLL